MFKGLIVFLFIFSFYNSKASNPPLAIGYSVLPATCSSSNGRITLNASGGVPPYTAFWFNGSNGMYLDNLAPGNYDVVLYDAAGDSVSATIPLTASPNLLNVDFHYTSPTNGYWTWPCPNTCNGIAYVNEYMIHGVAPYQVFITNPALQANYVPGGGLPYWEIPNICSDDLFFLNVVDATGCSSVTLNSYPTSPANFNYQEQVMPACFGSASGGVTLSFNQLFNNSAVVVNYSGPVSDSLISQNASFTVSNLLPGNYLFNVRYAGMLNCDTTISVVIPDLGFNCGLITGSVYLDTIPDCVMSLNEPTVPQQLIRIDPGPYFTTSDSNGNYSAPLPFNTYSLTSVAYEPVYSVCNASGITLNAINDTVTGVNLGDSVNITTDISIGLASSAFRPGFTGVLYVALQNLSYDLIPNPQVDIYYDIQLTFDSASAAPSANSPGHLTFMTNALNSFGSQYITMYFSVPASSPLGASFNFSAVATANIPEPDLSNNTDSLRVVVTGSVDPNDKAVANSRDAANAFFTDVDSEIEYRIRFQNIGTDTAFTVVIVDTLSADLDPSSFRFISASHPVQWEISGQRTLKFTFNNILLPDSNVNEPASHGAILFSIEPAVPVLATSITNRADIYFDFNAPVLTNTVSSTITTSVGVSNVSGRSIMKIVPNPASDEVIISLPGQSGISSIRVMNSLGQEVLYFETDRFSSEQVVNVSELPGGYYLVRIMSEQGESNSSGMIIHR